MKTNRTSKSTIKIPDLKRYITIQSRQLIAYSWQQNYEKQIFQTWNDATIDSKAPDFEQTNNE